MLKDLVRLKKKKQIFIKIVLKYVLTLGFPDSSIVKESACNAGDLGSIAGLGKYPGEGKGYPLQYSDLENSMDCIVHGVTESWTQLRDFHFQSFINKCSRKAFSSLLKKKKKGKEQVSDHYTI